MFQSFLITFREGLEAFLIVGILLSYLERVQAATYKRYLYLGVAAGVVASLVVAVLFQLVISQFENERYKTTLMIFILLFASGVLTYMAIWMQRQTRGKAASVQRELDRHIGARNLIGMVSLAFVAVLREGFETILFFSALTIADQEMTLRSGLTGGGLGLVSSVLLVYLLVSGTRKVPIGPYFKYTSLLLVIIAAGLLSSGVNMMQAIGWLPVWVEHLFDISFILDDRAGVGIFLRALFGYNASPSLLQFVAWSGHLAIFAYLWKRVYVSPPD